MNSRPSGPRAWLEQLLGAALTVLATAVALHWAVVLVRGDWPWLAGIGAAVVLVGALVAWRRQRAGRW